MKFKFLKLLLLTLEKTRFFVFEETPLNLFFFVFRLWFCFKINRHTTVLLFGIFENAKKIINRQKEIFASCKFSQKTINI